jgi:hypothetical protein
MQAKKEELNLQNVPTKLVPDLLNNSPPNHLTYRKDYIYHSYTTHFLFCRIYFLTCIGIERTPGVAASTASVSRRSTVEHDTIAVLQCCGWCWCTKGFVRCRNIGYQLGFPPALTRALYTKRAIYVKINKDKPPPPPPPPSYVRQSVIHCMIFQVFSSAAPPVFRPKVRSLRASHLTSLMPGSVCTMFKGPGFCSHGALAQVQRDPGIALLSSIPCPDAYSPELTCSTHYTYVMQ